MNDILPSIDRRISNLLELKRKIETEGVLKEHEGKVITISREFGCEAYPLANALKEKLEKLTQKTWAIFTEDAIDQVHSDSILSADLSENFGEQSKFLEAILSSLIPNRVTEEEYYRNVIKTIAAIAHRGHAILVGRGASVVTKDLPNCFHFRLIGGREFRAKSYADRHNVSMNEAEKIVVEKENLRKEFLERFLGKRFNLHNFHFIFNNDKVSTDRIADAIISFVYELH